METGLMDILSGIKLFNDFTSNELYITAENMAIKTYPANATICTEGELGSEFFVILEGKVRVQKKDNMNKEHELSFLNAGDCFGEMSLIDLQPRSASVMSIEETKVAALTHESFYKMQKESLAVYSHVLLNIAKEFSLRLRSMDSKYIKLLGFFF